MKEPRRRIDVNLEELDRVLDGARQAPLSESDHDKLRDALHALAAMLVRPRNTEKTSSVVGKPEDSAQLENSRTQTHLRPLDTAATEPKPSVAPKSGDQAPEVDPRRSLSGVREGQRVRAEGAEGAGAHHRSGAAGGHGLLAWSGCAAAPAGRCSRHRSRKAWARISTMNRRRR